MELDFSLIDNLGKSRPQKHTQKAPGTPRARENQSSKELHPISNKTPQKAKYDAKENIFDTFKLQRQEIQTGRKLLTEYPTGFRLLLE